MVFEFATTNGRNLSTDGQGRGKLGLPYRGPGMNRYNFFIHNVDEVFEKKSKILIHVWRQSYKIKLVLRSLILVLNFITGGFLQFRL